MDQYALEFDAIRDTLAHATTQLLTELYANHDWPRAAQVAETHDVAAAALLALTRIASPPAPAAGRYQGIPA